MAARGVPGLSGAYFCHGADCPQWLWPTYWWLGLPATFATFADADIADFVAYVPIEQLPAAWLPLLPTGVDSLPMRYVLLDFGEPGAGDRFMAFAFVPTADPNDPTTYWIWAPMNIPDDPVPVSNGNVQVHVGVPDF